MDFPKLIVSAVACAAFLGIGYYFISLSPATHETPTVSLAEQFPKEATSTTRWETGEASTSSSQEKKISSTTAKNPVATTSVEMFVTCSGLSKSQIQKKQAPGGPLISFTFDDGFRSAYEKGLPIVNAAGFKTTQYIITGYLDRGGKEYVSRQDVLAMQKAGNEIGAHSRTHPSLAKVPLSQAEDEICGSRHDLVALGISPLTFAYPEGSEDPDVEKIVQAAGFAGARGTSANFDNHESDTYDLQSYAITASTSVAQMESFIDQAVTNKEWLILDFHRIDEDGNRISATHEFVQAIVDYVKQKGVPVVTVGEGLGLMQNISNTTHLRL